MRGIPDHKALDLPPVLTANSFDLPPDATATERLTDNTRQRRLWPVLVG
jgi:hypothetical protein